MTQVLGKMLPIILLLILGQVIRRKNILQESTIGELKKMVINLFLPSVLFVTFVEMKLEVQYFMVFILSFVMLIAFYIVGCLLNKIPKLSHPMLPFVVTATTFGLLGLALYETAFGAEQLVKMSILGVGHELFIWFVYITLLKVKLSKEKIGIGIIKDFITSPLILSVVLGILVNVLGLSPFFMENTIGAGLFTTIKYLASIATPMILIIVGYGLVLRKEYTKQSIKFVAIRLLVMLTVGYAFKFLLFDRWMGNQPYFDYAFFTFLILPPPMSLPIFTSKYGTKEMGELINNTVVISTLLCILLFIGFNLILSY